MWKQPIPTNLVEILNGDKFAASVLTILLLRARASDATVYNNGVPVFLKRGQCICGRFELAEHFGMKRNEALRVQRILDKLEKTHKQINKQKSRDCSIITIVNYDIFCSFEQSDEQSMNNQRTIHEQSMNTNKIDKIDKSDKSDKKKDINMSDGFKTFLDFFNITLGTKYRPNKKIQSKFNARLKEGFSQNDMEIAIQNAFNDPFIMGDNDRGERYLTPEYILRADKLDKWLNHKPKQTKNNAFHNVKAIEIMAEWANEKEMKGEF